MSDSSDQRERTITDKDPLVTNILVLLSKVVDQFKPDSVEMKQWMTEHYPNPLIVEHLHDATLMMLKVLNAIGQLEPVNGITISKQYGMSRGTITKTTRRLLAKNLIQRGSLPNNKKEFLFRTTPLGKELFQAHRAFDQQMEKGFVRFLHKYNADELGFIIHLLEDIVQTSFLKPESDSGSE